MSSQGALKQDEGERWTGNGWSHWSHVLKPREDSSFVQDVDGVALRSGRARGGGGDGAGHFGEHVSSLTLSTGSWTDFGADSTLFSPSDSFSPSSQQLLQQSSSLYWQNLLGGQPNSRWLTRWPSPRFATFGGEPGTEQAGSLDTFSLAGHEVKRSDDVQLDVAVAYEINATNGVLSGIEVDRSPEVEIERNSNVNLERDNWKTLGDSMFGNVKQEEFWNTKETGHLLEDDIKSQISLSRNPEEVINFEPSPTSSDSNPDSEESNKRKKQFSNRKRKRPGQDADGNVTWTDESVTLLFETNDTIHRRLCTESKGQVKYEKKWIPILRAMQARFGNQFTKKQCQS